MKKELIQIMTERAALMLHEHSAAEFATKEETEDTFYIEFEEEETRHDSEADVESIVVDFDYDAEDDSNFQRYMALRFMWNDWNTLLTDIF